MTTAAIELRGVCKRYPFFALGTAFAFGGVKCRTFVAGRDVTPAKLCAHLLELRDTDMLFIDEVHALPNESQELLCSAFWYPGPRRQAALPAPRDARRGRTSVQ